MPTFWYESTIIEIKEIAPKVRTFKLEITNSDTFEFTPGQFITLDLPVSDKRINRWRSYSIASTPNNNILELCIVLNEQGMATPYLFELKIGDSIKFKGPEGTFTLPNSIEHPIVMIATGTGVVPFKSMLESISTNKIQHKGIHLIFGTRHESGILFKDFFENLQIEDKSFKYDIALSQSNSEKYLKGYVHQVYLENKIPNAHYYICGWSAMIDECVANLLMKMNVSKENIHFELYG